MAEKTDKNAEPVDPSSPSAEAVIAPEEEKSREAENTKEANIAELEAAKKALEEEVLSLKEQYLRERADADNFRKRMLKEKQEAIQFANKQLLGDLLPVIDDFERAIKSAEASRDFTAFHNGVIMIEKQLVDLLDRRWGLRRFDSAGEEFDPQKHEALSCEEKPGAETPRVIEDYRTGYTLHDKVFRTARVRIAMPAAGDGNKNANAEPQKNAEQAD